MKPGDIDRDEIMRLAGLAGLALTGEEAAASARDLGRILEYVRKIGELETDGVPATSHPFDVSCPLREDSPELRISVDPKRVMESAPSAEGAHFSVPLVVDPEEA
jgi:aspartyl-tRNA(Asn)/glutamyl-tRNA(Gln) amidotransferase subunit C